MESYALSCGIHQTRSYSPSASWSISWTGMGGRSSSLFFFSSLCLVPASISFSTSSTFRLSDNNKQLSSNVTMGIIIISDYCATTTDYCANTIHNIFLQISESSHNETDSQRSWLKIFFNSQFYLLLRPPPRPSCREQYARYLCTGSKKNGKHDKW